jgi:hypothetical protein
VSTLDRLYNLLPSMYRVRDAERTPPPLKALLAVLAEQVAALERDLDQLYDDHFIETCADWAAPYIGELVAYAPEAGVPPAVGSPRAEVARTIAYRRRKGTAAMLEQLARDATGWEAAGVEYFLHLATTQFMNHLRPTHAITPDMRRWEALERAGTPFDRLPRTANFRSIASGEGLHNIPNVGIHVFPVRAYPLTDTSATRVDAVRYRFNPLGFDAPLWTRPLTESTITHLATPLNAPLTISRRVLHERMADYYGRERSLFIRASYGAGALEDVPLADVRACTLADRATPGVWMHMPTDHIAIDPELGRIAFPAGREPSRVVVSFHYGFSGDLGGGEYARTAPPLTTGIAVDSVSIPADASTITAALAAPGNGSRVIEVSENETLSAPAALAVNTWPTLTIRAADGRRPVIHTGGIAAFGEADTELTLDGLVIEGGPITVPALREAGRPNGLRLLRIAHCTLVPGLSLTTDGRAAQPAAPSLLVHAPGVRVEIDRCIIGAIRATRETTVVISNSVVDATAADRVAFSAIDGTSPGGELDVRSSTIVGRVHTTQLCLASNTIFFTHAAESGGWQAPVRSERRQRGCIRFSFVPRGSVVPRRYRCQPSGADNVVPQFVSLRYGDATYARLAKRCTPAISEGADDGGEMGAWHMLHAPHRMRHARARVEQFLRFGLESGVLLAPAAPGETV